MALAIDAGDDLKRGDLFGVDPYKIDISEELRGRHKPPTEDAIVEMAESMFKYGQQQPVACRRMKPGNTLRLHAGFTRANAARLIRTGFVGSNDEFIKNDAFMLKCVVVEVSDNEAFLANVIENAHRNNTSPIDDAHNQRKLREQNMLSNEEIAALYRYKSGGVQKVERLASLLQLPETIQNRVHDGILSVDGAILLLDVPAEKREAVIEKAVNKNTGKVFGSKIKGQVREEHLRGGPKATASANGVAAKPKVKKLALSAKEIKKFFYDVSQDKDERLAEFGKVVVEWLAGQVKDKVMNKALDVLAAGPVEVGEEVEA